MGIDWEPVFAKKKEPHVYNLADIWNDTRPLSQDYYQLFDSVDETFQKHAMQPHMSWNPSISIATMRWARPKKYVFTAYF